MKILHVYRLLVLMLGTSSAIALDRNPTPKDYCNGPQPLRATARYTSPKGIGYNHGYSTLEFFVTPYKICTKRWLPFIDLRGHVFDNGRFAANAGLGLRYLSKKRIWGGNVYYDYRDTTRQHYNQIAIGLESLGKIFDYRINGYLPVGWKQSHRYNSAFSYFQGHSVMVQSSYDFALKTVNAEVGAHVNSMRKVPLYFAAGPYYMTGKGATTWGGCVRASIEFFNRYVKIEGNVAYDHFFKWTGQGQIGINIPFGGRCKVKKNDKQTCAQTIYLYTRAMQPVERNEIVPVGKQKTTSAAINPATNQLYHLVFVNNTSSSAGTYESPYPSLSVAQANSNPYDIIYLFPGDGTTTNMNQGITLQANQKLWGSSIAYSMPTTLGSITIPSMSSVAPKISNTNLLENAVNLNVNNEIGGIQIVQADYSAIYGNNAGNVYIHSCLISNINGGDGTVPIYLKSSGNSITANISNNTFTNNVNCGVTFELTEGTPLAQLVIQNNQFTDCTASLGNSAAICIDATGLVTSCQLIASHNVATNCVGSSGIKINDTIAAGAGSFTHFEATIENNNMTANASGFVYSTKADYCTLTLKNNNFSGNNGDNFAFGLTASKVTNAVLYLDHNQFSNALNSGNGISFSDFSYYNLTATITNNTISSNEGTGILMFNSTLPDNIQLTIQNNTISNNTNLGSNAAGGISIDGFDVLHLNISNNTWDNNTNGNAIGRFGSSPPFPTGEVCITFNNNNLTGTGATLEVDFFGSDSGCLTIQNNQSTEVGDAYVLYNADAGTFSIAPLDYEDVNVGTFNISGTITPISSCPCSED